MGLRPFNVNSSDSCAITVSTKRLNSRTNPHPLRRSSLGNKRQSLRRSYRISERWFYGYPTFVCLLSGRIEAEDRLTGREGYLERVLHFYGSRKASRNTNYSVYPIRTSMLRRIDSFLLRHRYFFLRNDRYLPTYIVFYKSFKMRSNNQWSFNK